MSRGTHAREAFLRHAAHFAAQLAGASRLYSEQPQGIRDGLDTLDSNWENIRIGQEWCAVNAGNDVGAAGLCSAFADAGRSVLPFRLAPAEQLKWFNTALEAARQAGDRSAEIRHLLGVAYAHLEAADIGSFQSSNLAAERYAGEALELARATGHPDECLALEILGIVHRELGNTDAALRYFQEELEAAAKLDESSGERSRIRPVAMANTAEIYLSLGDLAEAERYYQEALANARHEMLQTSILAGLGDLYRRQNQTARAISCHECLLEISRGIQSARAERIALSALGEDYLQTGDTLKAIGYFEQVLSVSRETGARRGEETAHGFLGQAYAQAGDYEQSFRCHERQAAIARELGNPEDECSALGNMAYALKRMGDFPGAVRWYAKCLGLATQCSNKHHQSIALSGLGTSYFAMGDTDQSIKYLQLDLATEREAENYEGHAHTWNNLAVAYSRKGLHGKIVESLNNVLGIARKIGDRRLEAETLFKLAIDCMEDPRWGWCRMLDLYDASQLGHQPDVTRAVSNAELAAEILEELQDSRAANVRETARAWRSTWRARGVEFRPVPPSPL